MQRLFILLNLVLFASITYAQGTDTKQKRVLSIIDSTRSPELVLIQEFTVNVPLDSVWNAYTTNKGMEGWAAAIAEVDLKVNGTIKTNYNKSGKIGDESTITLHVLNYVPKRLLTLQAELTANFPDFMKEDEKDLYNVILFEELAPDKTRLTSYGIGYKNNEKYMSLMKFFIQGNEMSYANLISYLESGKPSVKQ